jgi:glutathione S-transferase
MGEAILYAILGSHAARTGQLMLEHKGIPFRRKDLPPGPHRVIVRVLGFSGDRVPAVKFEDGTRGQGTRGLARTLDERMPERPLVPDDPRVDEADAWGDDVLQQWARRVVVCGAVNKPELISERGDDGRLGPLLTHGPRSRRMVCRGVKRAFKMTPEQFAEDERIAGELFDRVDALIADGVLNGPELHGADFQVASSLALAEYRLDIREQMQERPLTALMDRVLPA